MTRAWGLRAESAWRRLAAVMVLVLGCLFPIPTAADTPPPLRLDGPAASFALDGHLSVLDTDDGRSGIEEIARRGDFRAITSPASQPGLATGTLWYRVTVVRNAGMPAEWLLAFGEPDIDDVRVFLPAGDGGFTEIRLGRRIPSRQLPVAALRHVAMLDLPEAVPVTLHIRLASQHKIRFEAAELWRPGALAFGEARDSALFGIQFGMLVVIIILYALFGLWLRDGVMLAYALFVGTKLGGGLTYSGLIALVLPDSGGDLNYLLSGLSLLGGIAAYIFMWDRILDLRRTFPVMHRVYGLASAAVALALLSVMSPAFSAFVRPAQAIMLLASIGSIVMAVLLARRNPADMLIRFYLFAFLPVVLVWVAEIAAAIFPGIPADLGRRMDVSATMIHIVILSIALAYRLKQTQHERMRAEVALAGEQLARQRLRTFVDMATHEFKTPMAIIDSAVQMLEMKTPPGRPDISDRLAAIRQAVRRLVALVETCLTTERDTELALKLGPASPADIVERAAERNRGPDRPYLVVTMAGLPETCTADADLLGIALDALIDNARRYGTGGRSIEVSAQGNGGGISFSVRDHGPGIPPDEAARVFDKYYRCAASGAIPGTGIGLHLVKVIAEMHGGTAAYRPPPDGGARFVLSIPG